MITKKYLKLFSTKFQNLVEKIILIFVYIVGIGITSIIAKILKVDFLKMQPKKSTWEKPSGSKKLESMY